MPTEHILRQASRAVQLSALLLLPATALAQEKPESKAAEPVKATIETVATPVEFIRLQGKDLPLNLKTLAELQRLTEEQTLQEKLKETLDKAPVKTLKTQTPVPKKEAPKATPTPRKASPAPAYELLAVYGPQEAMSAEVNARGGLSTTLVVGSALGPYQVTEITPEGIFVQRPAKPNSTRLVRVGQRWR